jgi:hypothetical protein
MAYSGIELLKSLALSKVSAQLTLSSQRGRVQAWIKDGSLVRLSGCDVKQLRNHLMEPDPTITMAPARGGFVSNVDVSLTELLEEITGTRPKAQEASPNAPIMLTGAPSSGDDTGLLRKVLGISGRRDTEPYEFEPATVEASKEQASKDIDTGAAPQPATGPVPAQPKPSELEVVFAEGKPSQKFVGRDPRCEVIVDDPKVSRRHACILFTGFQFRIEDLNSTNGTRVNGVPIKNCSVDPGARVEVGSTGLILKVGSSR